MDTLKKFFPISFKMSKSVGSFVAGIIICLVAPTIVGFCIGVVLGVIAAIFAIIPIFGWIIDAFIIFIAGVIGMVLEVYGLASLVFLILDFCKMFDKKDDAIETTAEEVAPVAEGTPAE